MKEQHLKNIAEAEIQRTLAKLPEELRQALVNCRIETEDTSDSEDEKDLLGLFEGTSLMIPESESSSDLPCIRLFLENLWDHSGKNRAQFREEVRITLLHEIGHYLGLDEEQVAQLGLA